MNQIDEEFVFNKFPKTEHDVRLLEAYRLSLPSTPALTPVQALTHFPVDEDRAEETGASHLLTRFGFMALSIDSDFMGNHFRPWCRLFLEGDLRADMFKGNELRWLRASLTEFAILGSMEAQSLMERVNGLFGKDDEYVESIVNGRCPNLRRFLNAQAGAGRGVNAGDEVSSYEKALEEVRAGGKRTHWIWYVFPQMAGIRGTHSSPALFYGINGRIEAYQYINHPTLRRRLIEITEAVLDNSRTVYEIFGDDAMKVRASILLFASVSDIPVLKRMKGHYKW